MFLGEFDLSKVIDFKFSTRNASGPATLSSGQVYVYKSNSTTETQTGVTLTADFDTRTGFNNVRIDLSADGTFYATATEFDVVVTGTVGGVSICETLAHFCIANRASLKPTTAGRTLDVSAGGEAGLDWANIGSPTTTVGLSGTTTKNVTDVLADTANIKTRIPAALVGGRIDADVGGWAGTAVATPDNAGVPIVDVQFFNGDPAVAGTDDVNVLTWKSADADVGLRAAMGLSFANLNTLLTTTGVVLTSAGLNGITIQGVPLPKVIDYVAAKTVGKVADADQGTAHYYGMDGSTLRVTEVADTVGNRTVVTLAA